MSKMSQLHAELTEQAAKLGYESFEEAEANGYAVDYENCKLIDGQEQAHNDWLKERKEVLDGLTELSTGAVDGGYEQKILNKAIEFIKKGEI